MVKPKFLPAAAVMLCSLLCLSWKFFRNDSLKEKVDNYLSSAATEPDTGLVSELRKGGYKTAEWLSTAYWKTELDYKTYKSNKKFLNLFDKVCGQKDAIASHLFWYTNLDEALDQAKEQKKTVLCLQMLGNLDEDFSCANSRFFRTLLYSNFSVSKILRKKYILCWESVIKVPKITIEYPDGKKQVQTITGNSMHLILNSDGLILDALPGLYGPAYFEKWISNLSDKDYILHLQKNQALKIAQLKNPILINNLKKESWSNILTDEPYAEPNVPVKALEASQISVAKSFAEVPVYSSVYSVDKNKFKQLPADDPANFTSYKDFGYRWERVSGQTQKLIAAKKNYASAELEKTLKNISDNLTKENIRNDVRIHSTILQWLKKNSIASNKKEFVKKVYKELFLTPLNDNKMGLYDRSLFSATTDDGFLEE
jgi:hypothetical protein